MRKVRTYMQKYLLIFLFMATLLLPSVGGVFVQPDVSVENRVLTPFPEWHMISSLNDYESYLTDRIAFRSKMIQVSSYVDYFLFHKSMVPNVVIGKNGQLFYNEIGLFETNNYLLGKTKVPEDWLEGIVRVQNEV